MGAKRVRQKARSLETGHSGVPTGNVLPIVFIEQIKHLSTQYHIDLLNILVSMLQSPQLEGNDNTRYFTKGNGANRVRPRGQIRGKN